MIARIVSVITVLCFLSSCQSAAWRRAKEQNTFTSYQTFLKKYPSGKLSVKAEKAVQFLYWERARKEGSAGAYKRFILRYPQSEFTGVARRLEEEAALKDAENEGTQKAYQNFIRQNPESRLLKKVRKKVEELSWQAAQKQDSEFGYQHFIDLNRESAFKSMARERKERLRLEKFEVTSFNQTVKENTLDSYRLFLEIYPQGIYAKKAIALMVPLLPKALRERVEDLLSQNPLTRSLGALGLIKYKTDELLNITTLLINTLADTTPIHPEGRVWEKSSTIGEEIKKIFYTMGNRAVPPLSFALLLGGYMNSRYSREVRQGIVQTLAMIGDRDAVLPLIDLLKVEDIHYRVKLEAIKTLLTDFNEPDAIEISTELLSGYLQHKEREIRWDTVMELYDIKHPATVQPLILSLNDKDPLVLAEKIRVLGLRGDKRAVRPLIAILKSATGRRAKNNAADALTSIGDRLAIGPFIDLLKSNTHISLRRKAVKGLVKLYDPETDSSVTVCLVTLSKDPDQFIRLKAIEALERSGINATPTQQSPDSKPAVFNSRF